MEAALCVARLPEGQAAAAVERDATQEGQAAEARRAAVAPPLTSEEALQQAQAEGLVLRVGRSGTGYFGVHLANPGTPKPYQARVSHGGKMVHLGSFATAEEAALCVARTPEGRAAAKRAAVAAPLTSEEALQQAQAEGLVLHVAENWTGYFGVNLKNPGTPKPYKAHVWRGGKDVYLGSFASSEEAALCVARSPEGQP